VLCTLDLQAGMQLVWFLIDQYFGLDINPEPLNPEPLNPEPLNG
jgi:hypothetical protein